MAGLLDKTSGVMEICCDKNGRAYLGMSTGIGVAVRSAKSKLRNNIFHNKQLQADYHELGEDEISFLHHLPEKGETLPELFDRIKKDILRDEFLLYNEIEVVETENVSSMFHDLSEANKDKTVSFMRDLLREQ